MRHSPRHMTVIAPAFAAMFAFVGLRAPVVFAASAQGSQGSDTRPLVATIPSLQVCVQHVADMGFIDNQGVVQSLMATLDTAQATLDRGQPGVAVHTITAFEGEVIAQAGKHTDAGHAQHVVLHAQVVMQALEAEALGNSRGVAVIVME
jgi:hypothetical protein